MMMIGIGGGGLVVPFSTSFFSSSSSPSLSPTTFTAYSSSSSSSWGREREEERWIREEQRWLREEQRWIREEQRWLRDRDSLLRQIALLQRHHHQKTPSTPDKPEMLFPVPKEEDKKKARRTLRAGSQGDDVRALQEALEKLGFYSGEEDMEFSTFSSGTERAVKTWQASMNIREDGIMTIELLEKLFMDPIGWGSGSEAKSDQSNDKPQRAERVSRNEERVPSVTKVAHIQETVVKASNNGYIEESNHKVFLLGENRWEEPSRLHVKDNQASGRKPVSSVKCNPCRGEGRFMCIECDGTGEPNIEPQFLEWVGEETKCPYCDGLGYTICDACEGKAVVEN